MRSPTGIPIGERVRFYRQTRGKTQAVVAGLAGVTEDYLSQIERGLKTPSTALLHRLARVLGVPTSVLFGESAAEPATPGHPVSAAIHAALAADPSTADSDVTPDLPALRAQVDAAWRSWQRAPHRYSQTAPLLPDLITGVQAAVNVLQSTDAAAHREASRIAADLYFLLRTFTKRIGRTDLSLLVADRAVRAAQDAQDPLRVAAAKWNLGQVLLATNEPEIAEDITTHAAYELRPRIGQERDYLALYGALWLVAAVAQARCRDTWTARETLQERAAPAAKTTGEGNVLWTVFGSTNVALHQVSIEMEAGETSQALRLADDIDMTQCPSIERRATFCLDLARCYDQRHDDTGAILHLLAAEHESSEDMRYNPLARDLVRGLLRRARPSLVPKVQGLADRMDLIAN